MTATKMKSANGLFDDMDKPVMEYAQRHVIALRDDQTVGQALEQLRAADLGEKIVYFYVVDTDNRLQGVLPVRRLLMSKLDMRISEIMIRSVIYVPDTATLLVASEMLLVHRLMALPVVDSQQRLLGVLDITLFSDEVSSLAHENEVENAFQLIGVHVSMGRTVSFWSSLGDRFPWLLCNIVAGIACAIVIAMHESLLSTVTLLAFFMPVVLTVAESVGMQSTTLTLQSLHLHDSLPFLLSAIRRELVTALGLGLSSAILVGLVSYFWKGHLMASVAVALCLLGSVLIACTLGVLIPGVIKSLRVNPKIAAGPITLALADIVALTLLFSLAGEFLT